MTPEQNRAVLTIALIAAFADGRKDARERTRIREIAAGLPRTDVDSAAVYEEVLLGTPDVDALASALAADPRVAQLAYETAVNVVDADGAHTDAEGAFLERLARALRLPEAPARDYVTQADALATAAAPATAASARATAPATAAPARAATGVLQADAAELDKRIVDASITNAALELLPESLASMAILPLQMRLVYRIGQAHGYQLDSGHIKEFIATLGIGLTGQYLEQFGRKLLGGALGSVFGGMGGALGRQAASSGMAFATTWAIGQVAKQYYGSGRTLDTEALKGAFSGLVDRGRGMVAQYAPAIEERARSIDLRALPDLVRRV